nr:DUF2975 domain-containing protein [Lachnospiraceae bacterium]
GNNVGEKKRRKWFNVSNAFVFMLAMIVFFTLESLITDAMTPADAFEVRFENESTVENAGTFYRLYVDGQYYGDVDHNRYGILDDEGNTDYKFCTVIEDVSKLTYTLLLSVMLLIVIHIARDSADSTPFTKKNIDRVKMISVLQLLLAVLPGTVRMLMSFFRFNYYSSSFDITSWYMFVISAVIAMIAFIFQKGLDLQEDVDSIA